LDPLNLQVHAPVIVMKSHTKLITSQTLNAIQLNRPHAAEVKIHASQPMEAEPKRELSTSAEVSLLQNQSATTPVEAITNQRVENLNLTLPVLTLTVITIAAVTFPAHALAQNE
jgi:hypothetical protein